MANFTRNFIAGRMNKIVDQRVLPEGEYVDAMNVRMGSTEKSEVGVITNTKGNTPLTQLAYIDGTPLSTSAKCIGAIEDSANETIYWFVHDPAFTVGDTGKLDLIVSYNVLTERLIYHIISIDDGGGVNTTLNFNPSYLITGINIIENLLFWTDDYNAPRFINIRPTRDRYPNPVTNIDVLNPEAILVIKKPPTESPVVTPIITSGQENFLETRFICFAYRYRYVDGEYSATSQWSEPAFIPGSFEFSTNSMLNEGMKNICNTAIIKYNSGGPLVVGIDLLFKESNKNIIKIIEKLNKSDLGIPNNQIQQYSFNNSKIFTVLNEAEILRLYDNVPRFAKAQTIMGNRLMYGNYVEGYDLVDKNKVPVKFEYSTTLITEQIGNKDVPDSAASGLYNIDPSAIGESIPNATVYIDLTGLELIAGSSITLQLSFEHSEFTGDTPFPTETTDVFDLDFTFFLSTNYSSVYALASSPEFVEAIGTVANIKPVSTACTGTTFTDQFNCIVPNNLGIFTKIASGIDNIAEPFKIIATPASSSIGFQVPAMKYVDNIVTPTQTVYEYYTSVFADATYQKIATPSSLHSNRGYEVGIVYMDEFNRATTALVSQNNTVFVPCGYSANKNSIRVTIPPTQIAPSWAKRYKFVIKPDQENYETVYSNIFFTDPQTNFAWFLLEGENMKKVENGDKLLVKADTSGPSQTCAIATVLEKTAQADSFITPKENVIVLAGLYMKINPSTFNLVVDPNATVAPGEKETFAGVGGNYVTLQYPMNLTRVAGYDPLHPTWVYEDYSVPAGSKVTLYFKIDRCGTGSSCERLYAEYSSTFTSSRNYDNMYDWWIGDNIGNTLIRATTDSASIDFIPGFGQPAYSFDISHLQFNRDAATNRLWLNITSFYSCTGFGADCRRVFVNANIQVFRALDTIIFETQPSDALPDVFFENNLSFAIDDNGNHEGNVQDQINIITNPTGGVPAIIDTGFYNCYSFGNGAESYKINDSIVGRSFNLGERVTTVAAQDYKAADRFSDITYSGIYNGESNINKLNEFNAGLSNFKHCEASFGEIQLLDGRNTDILTLQEDKISYVLAEKNLLSDASVGGIITATPEVLGTQIARTEKYGISFNPESYVQWGYDRFFTDAKRGAVIQLKGGESQSEQLVVVSNQNMRTWFRDEFNSSFNYQKLGGFDPYMNEYVLSINDRQLPTNPQCLSCGVSQVFTLSIGTEESKQETYCVDLGPTVGFSKVAWIFTNIEEGATLDVSVDYDGTIVSSGPIDADGDITFNKNNISVETATITLTYTGDMVVSVIGECCVSEPLTVIEVVLTNDSESGSTIHTQYRYTNGVFTGPLLSNLVLFGSGTVTPLVSRYNISTGFAGDGGFPPEFSTMRLSTNAIAPDDYVFDIVQDKFRYLRSSTLYNNTSGDINSLLTASTVATPNLGSAPLYYADFEVPASIDGEYLYLIWDLRDAILTELCYAGEAFGYICCGCEPVNVYLNAPFATATSVFEDADMTNVAPDGYYSTGGFVRELVGGVLLPQTLCNSCAVCFEVDIAEAISPWSCSAESSGTYNGKPYYELLFNDCLTPTGAFVWWDTDTDRWILSDSVGSTVDIYMYNENPGLFPVSDITYPWVDLSLTIIILSSTLGECPISYICFCIYEEMVGCGYTVQLPLLGNAPYQNGRPVYNITGEVGEVMGSVYYDGEQWIYASQELAPILQPLLNSSYYPIGTYSEWGDAIITGFMYSSTLGECPI